MKVNSENVSMSQSSEKSTTRCTAAGRSARPPLVDASAAGTSPTQGNSA